MSFDITSFLMGKASGGGGGGGSGSWTKLAEQDFTVGTSSTTETDVGTIVCPGIVTDASKMIFVTVRDKAGKRTGYFYGTDSIIYNKTNRRVYIGYAYSNATLTYTANTFGIYPAFLLTDGKVTIMTRYNENYSLTIDGTYHVEVYTLEWPDNVSPFA